MTVLTEILAWSTARPLWQRDALRRIVTRPTLTPEDVDQLAELCKVGHGLSSHGQAIPLADIHLPAIPIANAVNLSSLTHVSGVNALANGQTLHFGKGLTVIYGANAAGKSGYTRILKQVCRARGAEEILGNCLVESAPEPPRATVSIDVEGTTETFTWSDAAQKPSKLSQVNVFDTHCASVYVKDKTDVAFRPFGLDVFDRLSAAVEGVRRTLEREQAQLSGAAVSLPAIAPNTAVGRLMSNLTSLTDPGSVNSLATLSDDETARLSFLRKWKVESQSADPRAIARMLELRARRFASLVQHFDMLTNALNKAFLDSVATANLAVRTTRAAASGRRLQAFEAAPVPHTGSSRWQTLWEAARAFSVEEAFVSRTFPHVNEDGVCLLCQRSFDTTSAARLVGFEEYLSSTVEREAVVATRRFEELIKRLNSLETRPTAVDDVLRELALESETLSTRASDALSASEGLRLSVLLSHSADSDALLVPLDHSNLVTELKAVTSSLIQRASELTQQRGNADLLQNELAELHARSQLGTFVDAVVGDIERKKRIAAYEVCLKEANTAAITRKSTELTKTTVTDRLTAAFATELSKLSFTHVEVELQAVGGSRGALYHKLQLVRARNVSLPTVVSEGEARALAIAAFFAELATAENPSGIIFDDPVSSLDHLWRERVASRLCLEAKSRQVIVFTHDIVFLLALNTAADRAGLEPKHQYIRRDQVGAGVCVAELPWVAMKVSQRLGVLNAKVQQILKLERDGKREEYEKEAAYLFGLLRETWERCVEEVLLDGVVERYRASIQTQQIEKLATITHEDCKTLSAGMTKTSRWLPGHDKAPAENVQMPSGVELQAEVQTLADWVRNVRARR